MWKKSVPGIEAVRNETMEVETVTDTEAVKHAAIEDEGDTVSDIIGNFYPIEMLMSFYPKWYCEL